MIPGSLVIVGLVAVLTAAWAVLLVRRAKLVERERSLVDDLIRQHGARVLYDKADPELRRRTERRRCQADRVRRRAARLDAGVEPRPRKSRSHEDTRQIRLIANE